jgi:hypothetical protein
MVAPRVGFTFARSWVALCVSAGLLAGAPRAWGQEEGGGSVEAPQDKRAQAKVIFKEGQALFEKGQFAESAATFERAFALDPHPAILYNIARAYEESGNLIRALHRFREGLRRSPSATVQAEIELKIKDLETFLGAQGVDTTDPREEDWAPVGLMSLLCDPPGAEVLVDGLSVGRAPLKEVKVAQGEHTLRIQSRGFRPQERQVKVVGGKSYLFKPRLEPGADDEAAVKFQPGVIDVTAPRRGLLIFVDGEPVGTTPAGQIEVRPGRHTVSIEGAGFKTWEQSLEVKSGEVAVVVAQAPTPIEVKVEDPGLLSDREWGWVTVSAGGGFLALGGLLGILALDQADDYATLRSDPSRPNYRSQAQALGVGADVSYVVGLGLVGAGLFLVLTDEEPDEALVVAPWGVEGGGGLGAAWAW